MPKASGVGRHDLRNVPEPLAGYPGDIPTSPHNTRRDLTPVAVVDVYDQQRRVRALARIDLLDRERRDGAINEAQYQVGREVERMFEPMKRISGGGQWHEGDRIDAASTAELATVLGMERAFAVNAFLGWLVKHLGPNDTHLLWFVLGRGQSFAVTAIAFGRPPGIRGKRYIADRFRDALSVLADAKAAKGRAISGRLQR